MSTTRGEQARRIPFDSPATISIQSSSPNSDRERTKTAIKNKIMNSTTKEIPSLNVITSFSPAKPTTHSRNLSLQQRRKQNKTTTEISKPISALSPSDGTLMIGLKLHAEFATSGLNIRQSITPEIVITPAANLQNPWKTHAGRRPRSSVYSQATHIPKAGEFSHDQLPPLPPIPGDPAGKIRPVSATSWHTDFSNDEEKEDLCRRYSGESQLGIIRSNTIMTNRRNSEGWWNQLVSPIFGRSNTLKRPDVPTREVEKMPTPAFLSVDPMADEKKRASRSSIWTDLSRLDAQRQTLAFFNDSPTAAKAAFNEKEISPDTPAQEGGLGLASEYYEATWHDAYSTEPFFKCQGHDCSQKIAYRHGKVIGGPDAEASGGLTAKNLALHTTSTSASEAPAIQDRALPISHTRNDSASTDIDAEPDAASEMHEAHSKASSKGGSPMPKTTRDFDPPSRTLTPDVSTSRKLTEPEWSTIASPAKAVRILGMNSKNPTPEPKLSTLRGMPEKSSASTASKEATGPAPVPVPLENPFMDAPYCASPEVLTPGLQKEFVENRAIPMEPTRSIPAAKEIDPLPHDPLNIAEPRRAPKPPQTAVVEDPFADPIRGATPPPPPPPVSMPSPAAYVYRHEPVTRDQAVDHGQAPYPNGDQFTNVSLNFPPPPGQAMSQPKDNQEKQEKKEKTSRGCAAICCFERKPGQQPSPNRKWYALIGGSLLALVILILILTLTITLHRSDTPIQTSWLNITGFPPIPTGIATIAQPDNAVEVNRCVAPNTLWSCSVPKEEQASLAPNAPNQPNFRLEIRFQNGSSALNSSNIVQTQSVHNAVSAGDYIRRKVVQARDSFTSSLFTPSPSPPSADEQKFLGQTTDNNVPPFAGEATPFFISFLPTTTSNTKRSENLEARQTSNNPFPNITVGIPPPLTNSDGTAAAANLLPFPTAQPLMLYNRGKNDEHYGFYTYFDRSIFLKSTDLLNSTGSDIPDNSDGGAERAAADVRCTWSQTRFLVQIWTNSGLQLLGNGTASSSSGNNNSATNFVQPGSFPYPVSITLDRHGGQDKQKMLYCYGMDVTGRIVPSDKQIHLENRAFGGSGLVNPGGNLFSENNATTAGGIDGGVGGCSCQWRNWR